MTKIEAKCAHRSKWFNKTQLTVLEDKAKQMTIDDDLEEYYYTLSLLMLSERDDYLFGRTDKRLTKGDLDV
jgi:hypothetical protein